MVEEVEVVEQFAKNAGVQLAKSRIILRRRLLVERANQCSFIDISLFNEHRAEPFMRVQFFLLVESVLYLARREQSEMNQKFP